MTAGLVFKGVPCYFRSFVRLFVQFDQKFNIFVIFDFFPYFSDFGDTKKWQN